MPTVKSAVSAVLQEWNGAKPFVYDELPTATSIRLVKIHPASHKKSDGVHLTLKTVELERRPRYTALSYTWAQQRGMGKVIAHAAWDAFTSWAKDGDSTFAFSEDGPPPKPSKSVQCNGVQMKIFDNVFGALKQLRDKFPGEWFWIDALSMNQQDEEEKTHQVRLMGEIYHLAQTVVVWFGELTCRDEFGLLLLKDLVESGKPLPPNPLLITPLDEGTTTGEKSISRQRLAHAARVAFHLVRRAWFRRVWVVQELCLSRNAIFIHGDQEISLEVLYASCDWFFGDSLGAKAERGIWAGTFVKALPYFGTHMQFLPTMMDARQDLRNGRKWTLMKWYQICSGRHATEAKDFIFAGLALVRDDVLSIDGTLQPLVDPPPLPPRRGQEDIERRDIEERRDKTRESKASSIKKSSDTTAPDDGLKALLPVRLWPKLVADYSVSDLEVFINAAACLLTHEPLENVLRLAFRLRKILSWISFGGPASLEDPTLGEAPSWVPAPGSWMSGITLGLTKIGNTSPWAAWRFETHQSPTIQQLNTPKISPDGRILTIDAARLDVVEYTLKIHNTFSEISLAVGDLLILIQYLVDEPMWYSPNYADITVTDGKEVAALEKLTLFEVIAHTLVSGHVGDGPITHANAQDLLAESLESRVRELVSWNQARISRDHKKMKAHEAIAQKPGYKATNEKATKKAAKQYRLAMKDVDVAQKTIVKLITSLKALQEKYAHISWPGEAVAPIPSAELRAEGHEEAKMPIFSKPPPKEPRDLRFWRGVSEVMSKRYMGQEWSIYPSLSRPISDACRNYEESAMLAMAYRRLFVTKNGFIGSSMRWTEEGAEVFLIPGCSVPFVFMGEIQAVSNQIAKLQKKIDEAREKDRNGQDDFVKDTHQASEIKLTELKEKLNRLKRDDTQRHFLVGDGYFEGVMQGELRGKLKLERLSIG